MNFNSHQTKQIDPETATLNQVLNHKGRSHSINTQNMRNFRRSGPFVLATLGGSLLFSYFYSKLFSKFQFNGADNKGGEIIRLTTKYTEDGIAYNRVFQKRNYMATPNYQTEFNKDLESELIRRNKSSEIQISPSLTDSRKKAPHPKYF